MNMTDNPELKLTLAVFPTAFAVDSNGREYPTQLRFKWGLQPADRRRAPVVISRWLRASKLPDLSIESTEQSDWIVPNVKDTFRLHVTVAGIPVPIPDQTIADVQVNLRRRDIEAVNVRSELDWKWVAPTLLH
jgi:hypothetical protein